MQHWFQVHDGTLALSLHEQNIYNTSKLNDETFERFSLPGKHP